MRLSLILFLLLAGSSFAWWDASFPYRTQVNISNGGSLLTDYQANFSLNTQALVSAGKMRSDCADLRVVASNDSAQLPFWIEGGCNTTTTKIWVKVPSIPTGASTIYLYYGNPSAANAGNGTGTFEFFDDFSGSSLDLSKWDVIDSPTISVSGGELSISGWSVYAQTGIVSKSKYDHISTTQYKVKTSSLSSYTFIGRSDRNTGDFSAGDSVGNSFYGTSQLYQYTYSNGVRTNYNLPSFAFATGVYYFASIQNNGSSVKLSFADSPMSVYTTGVPNKTMYVRLAGHSGYASTINTFDWIFIRKYASVEPAAMMLAEQEALQFTYRKGILLNNTGSALSDYQVNLTMDTASLISAGKMKSDCSDLRFTDSTSYNTQNWTANHKYWIESGCNTTTTKIWVKAPSIPNGMSTIYLYYGNPSAVPGANGNATFEFFDDFSGNSLDNSKWITDNGAGFSVGGGELHAIGTWGRIHSIATFSQPVVQEINVRLISTAYTGVTFGGFWNSSTDGFSILMQGNSGGNDCYVRNSGTWVSIGGAFPIAPLSVSLQASGGNVFVKSTRTDTGAVTYSGTHANNVSADSIMIGIRPDDVSGGGEAYWDVIRVRKYATTEPTSALGQEEEIPRQYTDRKQITISNGGSGLADYQVTISLNTQALVSAGKMRADCGDIRFTNSSSYNSGDWTASYPYWIEAGCNTNATKIWVKVPVIPAGASTLYAYHGNASALSAGNGMSTFVDFTEATTASIGAWAQGPMFGITGLTWEIYGNEIHYKSTLADGYNDVRKSIPSSLAKYAIKWTKFKVVSGGAGSFWVYQDVSNRLVQESLFYSANTITPFSYPVSLNAYYSITMAVDETAAKVSYYLYDSNGTLLQQVLNQPYLVGSPTNGLSMGIVDGTSSSGTDIYLSNVLLRQYASPEPTATEQQPDTTPPAVQIQSPTSQAYLTASVPVNFTATDETSVSCTVRLNGTVNSSTCSNYTLTLGNGAYTLNVSANDTAGNVNSTQAQFTVAIPSGQQSNTTQASTGADGVADGTIGFAFTPSSLTIQAGGQTASKAIAISAGVNRAQIKAKITLKGQAVAGKQVTFTLLGPA